MAEWRDVVARTLLGEARGEGELGMRAVAHVIANRVADPRWPGDPGAVAMQPAQFVGASYQPRDPSEMAKASAVVDAVFGGRSVDPTNGAVNFYAPRGMEGGKAPKWASQTEAENLVEIGGHRFSGRRKGSEGGGMGIGVRPATMETAQGPRRTVSTTIADDGEARRKAALAEALSSAADQFEAGSTPTGGSWTQGLASVLNAGLAGYAGGRASEARQEAQGLDDARRAQLAQALGSDPALAQLDPDLAAQAAIAQGARDPEMEAMEKRLMQARIVQAERPERPDDPIAGLRARAQAAGLVEGTPEYSDFMRSGGRTDTKRVIYGPDGNPVYAEGVDPSAVKLTEQQSKDLVYIQRAQGASPILDQMDGALASWSDKAASGVPFVGNAMTSQDFQLANQAGREWLAAILRKDTGAAITNQEIEIYGQMYLPQPGDKPETVAQKREARARATAAIESGLGTAQIILDEMRRRAGGAAQPAQQPAVNAGVGGANPTPGETEIDGFRIRRVQ